MHQLTLIFALLVALATETTLAADPKFDHYTGRNGRPSILDVSEADSPYVNENYLQAHVEAAAVLMALYENDDLFILARDAEGLYDTLRLLNPKSTRLHLLNVSRQHLTSDKTERLLKYLEQEGISAENIARLRDKGESAVFVDTGFSGTIPYFIKAAVFGDRPELREAMHTHLLASSVGSIPSVRMFSAVLGARKSQSAHDAIVDSVEHIPHYTAKSVDYALVDGRWVPISPRYFAPVIESEEGKENHSIANTQSRAAALDIMGMVKRYVSSGGGQTLYTSRLEFYRRVMQLVAQKDEVGLIEALRSKHNVNGWEFLQYAMTDIVDYYETRHNEASATLLKRALVGSGLITERVLELDLQTSTSADSEEESEKIKFILAHPDLKDLVIDPDSLPQAMADGKFAPILEILNHGYDEEEFLKMVAEGIANFPRTETNVEAMDAFVQKVLGIAAMNDRWNQIAEYVRHRPDTLPLYRWFVSGIVAKRDDDTLREMYLPTLADDAWLVQQLSTIFDKPLYSTQFVLAFVDATAREPRFRKYREPMLRSIQNLLRTDNREQAKQFFDALREHVRSDNDDGLFRVLSYASGLTPADARTFVAEAITDFGMSPTSVEFAERMSSVRNFNPSAKYGVGDQFLTPKRHIPMTVEKVEKMRDGVHVYWVRSGSGLPFRFYAFQRNDAGEREVQQMRLSEKALEKLDNAHFETVSTLEKGTWHRVVERLDGDDARTWLTQWAAQGSPKTDPRFVDLMRILKQISSQRMELRDVRAKDLVWNGLQWVFTASTPIRKDIEPDDALYHMLNRVETWGAALDSCGRELLSKTLDSVE